MRITSLVVAVLIPVLSAPAQEPQPVALTIYNQNFAVARTFIDLDLHAGTNEITSSEVTSRLEPDSVVLRDPSGKRTIHVVEQNYDSAVVSQEWLLRNTKARLSTFKSRHRKERRLFRAGLFARDFSGKRNTARASNQLNL